jgi:hypothetical protein
VRTRSCAFRGVVAFGAVTVMASAAACAVPPGNPVPSRPGIEHVHDLDVHPESAAVFIATHDGLLRLGARGAEPAGNTGRDLKSVTVSGADTLLTSGHPAPDEVDAHPLGLLGSTDGGASWTPLSLAGQGDFHALEVSSGTLYGLDGGRSVLQVSHDGGRTWQARASLEALDIAVDPTDPAVVLAAVGLGVAVSTDGGTTFAPPAGPQLIVLSWAPDGTIYGLDGAGELHRSLDGGGTWQRVGNVPGRPQAVVGLNGDRVVAASAEGVFDSRDGGRTFVPIL